MHETESSGSEQNQELGASRRCPICDDGSSQVVERVEYLLGSRRWRCRRNHIELIGAQCSSCGEAASLEIPPECALCVPCAEEIASLEDDEVDAQFKSWERPIAMTPATRRAIRQRCQRRFWLQTE